MNGFVNISAEELLRVSKICLFEHENYNGEDDIEYEIWSDLFWWKKKSTYRVSPRWTYTGVGIQTVLKDFINIAESNILYESCSDKEIRMSLTMYSELYKLLNKSDDFQPYIFGNGRY